jgi:hypothetical protein
MDKSKANKARKKQTKQSTPKSDAIGTLADMLSPAMQKKLKMHPENRIKNMIKEARKNPEVLKAEENLRKKAD